MSNSKVAKEMKLVDNSIIKIKNSEFLIVHFLNIDDNLDVIKQRYNLEKLNQYRASLLLVDESKILYLGENGKETASSKILQLVYELQKELGLNSFRTITVGEEVGALGALTLIKEINAKYSFVKDPIVKVGTYIDSLEDFENQKVVETIFGIKKPNANIILDDLLIKKVNNIETKYWDKTRVYLDEDVDIKKHIINKKFFNEKKVEYKIIQSNENKINLMQKVFKEIETMKYISKPIVLMNSSNQLDLKLKFKNLDENCDWAFYFYSNKKLIYKKLYNNNLQHTIEKPKFNVTHVKIFLRENKELIDVQIYYVGK